MSRFSAIAKGTRAVKREEVALVGGELVSVGVRPLLGIDEAGVLEQARAFAKARGVESPKEGDPLYQLGVWVHTLLLGVVDPDDEAAPFFDGGAAQVLEHLDRDRIALLYELQQSWQDHCSPRRRQMSPDDYIKSVLEIAAADEGDDGPFVRLSPVLRWSWARSSARLLLASPLLKSPGSSDSVPSTSA